MDKLSAQRKLIEEDKNTLKRKRQEFEAITANMTEGLVLINDLLQVIDINKSGKAILETDESIIGKSITEIKNYSLFIVFYLMFLPFFVKLFLGSYKLVFIRLIKLSPVD